MIHPWVMDNNLCKILSRSNMTVGVMATNWRTWRYGLSLRSGHILKTGQLSWETSIYNMEIRSYDPGIVLATNSRTLRCDLVSRSWRTLRSCTTQETAKDGMAGLQSGNKIWEDWLRTSLKAMVNLRYCMTLKFDWTKSRSQKCQQNLRRST